MKLLGVLCMCVAALPWNAFAQDRAMQSGTDLPKGVVIERVSCQASPAQSYALYLPTSYSPERRWPVLYAFDPGAQGAVPVEQVKQLAEQYGYIVAGSNNSHNGPREPQIEAARAMFGDTQNRFTIDPRRIYLTGFSGGARVAGMVALLCRDCPAVIAHGAGLPVDTPARDLRFAFFGAIGDLDFNYPELARLDSMLDEHGITHRIRRYPGPHGWAPPEVWAEAFEWMELLAMRDGRLSKDERFIAARLARSTERAQHFEATRDLHAAAEEYFYLAAEFTGLTDTSQFMQKAAALRKTKEARDALKHEREQIRLQEHIVQELNQYFLAFRIDAESRREALHSLSSRARRLRADVRDAKDPQTVLGVRRALTHVLVVAYETGEGSLRQKNYSLAAAYFEAAGELMPHSPGIFLQLARAHALARNKREGMVALRRAVDNGFRADSFLQTYPEFSAWQEDDNFKKLLKDLATTPPATP